MRKEALSKQEEMQHAAQRAQQMIADAGVPTTTTTAAVSEQAAPAAAAATAVAPTTQKEQQASAQPLPIPSAAAAPVQLPLGWASAKDAQNRTYYYHTQTKKVQWQPPTAETSIT